MTFFLTFSVLLKSQDQQFSKAELKELARSAERLNDPETAAEYYQLYLERKPSDLKMHYQLASQYRKLGNYKSAAKHYQLVFQEKKKKYPLASFYWAEMLSAQDSCEKAVPIYDQFRKDYRGEKDDRKYRRLAKFGIEGCEELKSNSDNLMITPFPNQINSARMEGAPIFLNEDRILFNRMESQSQETYAVEEDKQLPERKYFVMEKQAEEWTEQGLWKELNIPESYQVVNGAFNFTKDRFYFSTCQTDHLGELNCDIYLSVKSGENWKAPIKLNEEINTKYIETQPAVGLDEKGRETLYFVSDRKEGKGGKDIWYTTYKAKHNEFRTPRNSGSRINSVGDEITPFVNPINGKLYFSSNGHPGYGQFDIYKSTGQRSRWQEPINLGKPINSAQDDSYYVSNPLGNGGVFASNRPYPNKQALSACCDDLFEFKDPDQIQLSLKGKVVVNDSTLSNVSKADLRLYSRDSSGELYFNRRVYTNEDGEYDLILEADEDYVIKAGGDKYLTEVKKLSTKGALETNNYKVDFKLEPKRGKTFEMKNIYFEFGNAELTEEAKITLDTTLYRILIENPAIKIEVGAHTDSKGTEAFNEHLSQKRAESVVNYLRRKGIAKDRLTAKGYGESQPIAPNSNEDGSDNEEGRAKNRRTEFKVIGEIELEED